METEKAIAELSNRLRCEEQLTESAPGKLLTLLEREIGGFFE